jgi:quercetin dioxygenase-like cupin family protein
VCLHRRFVAACTVSLFAFTVFAAAGAAAQDTLHFVPAGKLAIRDMNAIPWQAGPNGLRTRTIVGSIGSLTLAELAPGGVTVLHHHTRQQVDVGLTGELQFRLDTGTIVLHRGDWVMVGADVMHGAKNTSAAPAQLLELHTVRRLDLAPPYPVTQWPQSAEPREVMLWNYAHGAYDSTKFASPMSNETSSVDVDRVRNFTINNGTNSEEFVYIVDGHGSARILGGDTRQDVGPGNVIVIPPDTKVVLESPDRNRIFVVTLTARAKP